MPKVKFGDIVQYTVDGRTHVLRVVTVCGARVDLESRRGCFRFDDVPVRDVEVIHLDGRSAEE
jgi:hypothetical protein